jgi:drug/metabolite transporter (DMT)-like permease
VTPLLIAIAASGASAVLAYTGSALQAHEARQMPDELSLRPGLLFGLLRRPLWLLGTGMNIVAFVVQVVALSLASLAIVQPTFALGLVVLVVIAAWKLQERVGRWELVGIAAIIVGLVGLAVVAPRHNRLPLDLPAAIVLGSALALLAVLLLLMLRQNFVGGLVASLAAGLAYAWVSFGGTLVGEAFNRHRWLETGAWACATVVGAVLALGTEMTALQRWPVTRSKPVVFVLQTLLPALVAPFFAAAGFGPFHGIPFAISLLVVSAGAAAVGASKSVAKVAG